MKRPHYTLMPIIKTAYMKTRSGFGTVLLDEMGKTTSEFWLDVEAATPMQIVDYKEYLTKRGLTEEVAEIEDKLEGKGNAR